MNSWRLRPRSLRWLSLVLICAWLLPMARSVWAADSAQLVCGASGHVRLLWSDEAGGDEAAAARAGDASCVLCVLPSLPPAETPTFAAPEAVPESVFTPPVLAVRAEWHDGAVPARGPPARRAG